MDKRYHQMAIRGIDQDVWRRARSKAVFNQIKMGPLLTILLEEWLRGKIKIKIR